MKEFGGVFKCRVVSEEVEYFVFCGLIVGWVFDYGCGFGFDVDYFGWDVFDLYYC